MARRTALIDVRARPGILTNGIVTNGIATTFEALAGSRNDAAVSVLARVLDSPSGPLAEKAIRALLARSGKASQREILDRWLRLDVDLRRLASERPGRLSAVSREALLGADRRLSESAAAAILECDDFEQFGLLARLVDDERYPHADLVDELIVELSDRLYDGATALDDYVRQRELQRVRTHAVDVLQPLAERFADHGRRPAVEAFCSLVRRENTVLRRVLREPREASHEPMCDVLLNSPRVGVIHLLVSFLDDPYAPLSALDILSRRYDRPFLRELTGRLAAPPQRAVVENLRRLESIVWLGTDFAVIDDLDEISQAGAVRLAAASGMARLDVLELLEHVLRYGNVGGRRAASNVLPGFDDPKATELLRSALDDPDPQVQANVLAHLRPRNVQGALATLVAMVESPHDLVRQAAREGLEEFNFERFLRTFDTMDEDVRCTTGVLVKKVDPQALHDLAHELSAMSRTRRIRALAAAESMEAVVEMEELILTLLKDSDHMVRAAAAQALGDCPTTATRDALREALIDRSVVVQEAAENSLFRLANQLRQSRGEQAVTTHNAIGAVETSQKSGRTYVLDRLSADIVERLGLPQESS
ncbi:MAG: HEAT repeat domain-containing protein [Pirellulales bacterium]